MPADGIGRSPRTPAVTQATQILPLFLTRQTALTVHKTQALSIKHLVRGCLEGVFAQGQVYVLTADGLDAATPWTRACKRPTLHLSPWLRRALSVSRISRVTDPRNLTLVGLPPKDLLVEVMAGWQATGYDGIECLRNACSVSKDFLYVPDPSLLYSTGSRFAESRRSS